MPRRKFGRSTRGLIIADRARTGIQQDRALELYGLTAQGDLHRGRVVRDRRGMLGVFVGIDRRLVAHVAWYDPDRGDDREAIYRTACVSFDRRLGL